MSRVRGARGWQCCGSGFLGQKVRGVDEKWQRAPCVLSVCDPPGRRTTTPAPTGKLRPRPAPATRPRATSRAVPGSDHGSEGMRLAS